MKSKLLILGAIAVLGCGAAVAEDAEGTYKPGKGFTLQTSDGDHKMNVGGRIQARYTYTDFDSDTGKDERSEFEAKRVRVHIKGHVFNDVKYKFQADFGDGRSGDNLKDAVITYAKYKEAQFSAGQLRCRGDVGRKGQNSTGDEANSQITSQMNDMLNTNVDCLAASECTASVTTSSG